MTTPDRRIQIIGWLVIIGIVAGSCLLMLKVAHILFPKVGSLTAGLNPIIVSQFGTEIPASSKLLRMEVRPYTGFHAPGDVYEENVFGERGRQVTYRFKTNKYGFLTKYDIEPLGSTRLKQSARDRVVLLTGGSAAWGWGATSNDTIIASQLELLLNHSDADHRWFVVNLAMPTWITYQEALSLDLYGSTLDPDWVIVFDGRNDMLVPTVFGEPTPNYFMFGALRKMSQVFDADPAQGLLARSLQPFQLSRKIVEVQAPPKPVLTDEGVDKAVAFYLHSINRIVQQFGRSRLLLVTQPTTAYSHASTEPRSVMLTKGYDMFIPELEKLARTTPNVEYRNSASWFDAPLDRYLTDDVHLNDAGQAIVAKRLAELVLAPSF